MQELRRSQAALIAEPLPPSVERSHEDSIFTRAAAFAVSARRSAFAIAATVFLALNVTLLLSSLGDESRKPEPTSKSLTTVPSFEWWRINSYLNRDRAPDVVLLGSSLIMYSLFMTDADQTGQDIDCVTHSSSDYMTQKLAGLGVNGECFNFGLPGGMVSDDYMIAKALFKSENKPTSVVLALSLRDFIDNRIPSPASTPSFQLLKPFVPLDELMTIAYPEPIQQLKYVAQRAVCLWGRKVDPKTAFDRAAEHVVHEFQYIAFGDNIYARDLDATVMLPENSLPPGSRKGLFFKPNKGFPFIDNTRSYQYAYRTANETMFNAQSAFLTKLLKLLNEQNINVTVVNMPVPKENMEIMPPGSYGRYLSTVKKATTSFKVPLVDLNDGKSFLLSDYYDFAHLNGRGGKKFVDKIVARIHTGRRASDSIAGARVKAKQL